MRVLIADDHDLLRDTLIAFLSADQDMELGSASSFEEAKRRIREDAPYNLVLLDYKMPGMKGLESLSEAIDMDGGQRVALISGQATREIAEEALGLGAAGFVPKTLPAKSLVNAVKFMAMGEQYAPIDFMKAQDAEEPHAMSERLTKREQEVLKGLTEGKSNKAIARDLDLTEPTIKLHMKTLFRKLEVNNRTQAAIVARDAGFF